MLGFTIKSFLLLTSLLWICSAQLAVHRGISLAPSQGVLSNTSWECLRQQKYTFVIVKIWDGPKQLNINTTTNIQGASQLGLTDIQAFLCINCQDNDSPPQVLERITNYASLTETVYNRFWISVVSCKNDNSCWSLPEANLAYIEQAVKYLQDRNIQAGIYTDAENWYAIMGDLQSEVLGALPLWYKGDNRMSFQDFFDRPFGGWGRPAIKQYESEAMLCETRLDKLVAM